MLKNTIQKFILFAALTATIFSPVFATVDYRIEHQSQVIEKVVEFEQKGILKQKENGFLYVAVSNEFIAAALPLIETDYTIVPSRDYTSKKGIGAHISVIYEKELQANRIGAIKELGQEFTFTVMELRTVEFKQESKVKKLWLIAVYAPELEYLRESYGLSTKLKGHDFHITIGTEVLGTQKVIIDELIFEEIEEQKEAA